MNKDTIYIEPEDDITDIISKLKSAKQKFVALVPPKKSGVLHSAVNIKLIARAARENEKVAILITTDDSVIKMAAAAHLPIAATLQDRASIPTLEDIESTADTEEEPEEAPAASVAAAEEFTKEPVSASKLVEEKEEKVVKKVIKKEIEVTEVDDSTKKADAAEEDESAEPEKKSSSKFKVPSLDKYRKWIIAGAAAVVLIAGFLVWALLFSQSVNITVSVSTSQPHNFSENITFVTKEEDEDAEAGKLFLEERKISEESTVEFTATGEKNVGEKAKGTVTVYSYVKRGGSKVPAGAVFTHDGNQYTANGEVELSYSSLSDCKNSADQIIGGDGCLVYASVDVTAAESGAKYNLSATDSGWRSNSDVFAVANSGEISGGTDKVITIVQQSDVDKAKSQLTSGLESVNKNKLKEEMPEGVIALESSFKQTVSDPEVSPKVGEEVKEGVKPTIKATTTSIMYSLDQVRVEEFIAKKTNLSDDQKIYSISNPFVDRFMESEGGYTGKLKATYKTGPQITPEIVLEKVSGQKIGKAKSLIESIVGISRTDVSPSFFWVTTVPTDPNKVHITITEE